MAGLMAFGVVLGIVVLLLVWTVGLYNGLVVLRNRYKNAYAQIDVQLKRRYDLIPNLVETAKGYLKHERETLEAVIAAIYLDLGPEFLRGWILALWHAHPEAICRVPCKK